MFPCSGLRVLAQPNTPGSILHWEKLYLVKPALEEGQMGGGQEDQVDESIFCSNICNLIVYDSDNKENEDSDEKTIVGNFTLRGFG